MIGETRFLPAPSKSTRRTRSIRPFRPTRGTAIAP